VRCLLSPYSRRTTAKRYFVTIYTYRNFF
jgi:hypothetical protein